MDLSHWLTIGIFLATNLVTVAGIIISTRIDTSKLKDKMSELAVDMQAMQMEMKQFGNILVTLADFKGEINRLVDRQIAQAQRLDDFIKQSNDRNKEIWAKLDQLNVESRRS